MKKLQLETLKGKHCCLIPLSADDMHEELLKAAQSDDRIWQYMPYGPFKNNVEMKAWLFSMQNSSSDFIFGVKRNHFNQFVGMCGFLAHVPEHKRIEIGHVWYGTEAQKTKINTEATYLLLKFAFEKLNYRRVEWKCHAANTESERTALRMGFVFEGLFRNHMWVKNQSRDTKYFSMIDTEWPKHRADFEIYLHSDAVSLTTIKNKQRNF